MKVFPRPLRRSPFTRPPLRSPGQSVQREMDRLLEDRMLPVVVFAGVLVLIAVHDWLVVLLNYKVPTALDDPGRPGSRVCHVQIRRLQADR